MDQLLERVVGLFIISGAEIIWNLCIQSKITPMRVVTKKISSCYNLESKRGYELFHQIGERYEGKKHQRVGIRSNGYLSMILFLIRNALPSKLPNMPIWIPHPMTGE